MDVKNRVLMAEDYKRELVVEVKLKELECSTQKLVEELMEDCKSGVDFVVDLLGVKLAELKEGSHMWELMEVFPVGLV